MNKVFFIADLHFGHSKIIEYCNRPYKDVDDMNESLIKNWNSVVSDNDIVYHLGDFAFHKTPEIFFKRLKGKKFMLKGNHDKHNSDLIPFMEDSIQQIKIDGNRFVMCHYPMLSWDGSNHGVNFLYGHVHNNNDIYYIPNSLCVSVENINYTPIESTEVIKLIDEANKKLGEDK